MKLFIVLFTIYLIFSKIEAHSKIKLTDLQVLTLNYGLMTNGRRSPSVPQLECTGGSAKCRDKYLPRVVQCQNMGSDGYDVQWKCQADLPSNLRFGKIDVNCEGYDYPNDKYVLTGSCGLRYTLDINRSTNKNYEESNNKSSSIDKTIAFVLFVVVVIVVLFGCVYSNNSSTDEHTFTAAPPPPGFRPDYTSGPPPPGFQSDYNVPPPYESVHRNKYYQDRRNDGPGFWTGLGAGGLMGYLFGSRTNTQTNYQTETSYSVPHTQWRDNDYSYTSRRRHDSDSAPDYHTASGFGSTSRR